MKMDKKYFKSTELRNYQSPRNIMTIGGAYTVSWHMWPESSYKN